MFTLDTATLLFPHRTRKGREERRQRDMGVGGGRKGGRGRRGEAGNKEEAPEGTFPSFLL